MHVATNRSSTCLAAALALLGGPVSADAQDSVCRTRETAVVDLVLWGDHPSTDRLEAVVRDLLGLLEVTVCRGGSRNVNPEDIAERPPDPPPAESRIWIAHRDDIAIVYLVDKRWERVVVRRVPLDEGLDEVAIEQIAHLIYGTVEALRAGRAVGVPASELALAVDPTNQVADAATTERPASASVSREHSPVDSLAWDATISARYGARLQGVAGLQHELGAMGVLLHSFGDVKGFLRITALYRFGNALAETPVVLQTSGLRGAMEIGVHLPLSTVTGIRIGGGAGIDVDFVQIEAATDSEVTPRPSTTTTRPSLLAGVTLQSSMGPLVLAIGFEVLVTISDVKYAVQEPELRTIVADPWTVQPAAVVAVGLAL